MHARVVCGTHTLTLYFCTAADDDNFYDPSDSSLYPSFRSGPSTSAPSGSDPFGLAHHNPFSDASRDPAHEEIVQDLTTKLDLLVLMEVTPLFAYLASPTFQLTSMTVPLYFISKNSHHHRSVTRPGYTLPLKIRYWVQVCVHALLMLRDASCSSLNQVRVRYLPWDIWASMEPADNLSRMVDKGVWFDPAEDVAGSEREGEGEAFRAVWAGMNQRLVDVHHCERSAPRMGLSAQISLLPWNGNVDSRRVGDELEVVFTRVR